MGNSIVTAGSKQPAVGGGEAPNQSNSSPQASPLLPGDVFDPQQAYAEQQRRNAATGAAENLTASVTAVYQATHNKSFSLLNIFNIDFQYLPSHP